MLKAEIERIAREAATAIGTGYVAPDDHWPPRYNRDDIVGEIAIAIESAILAALKSEVVGYRMALVWQRELAHNKEAVEADEKVKELDEL